MSEFHEYLTREEIATARKAVEAMADPTVEIVPQVSVLHFIDRRHLKASSCVFRASIVAQRKDPECTDAPFELYSGVPWDTIEAAKKDIDHVQAAFDKLMKTYRRDNPDTTKADIDAQFRRAFGQGRTCSSLDAKICRDGNAEQLAVNPYPNGSKLAAEWDRGYHYQSAMENG
jgi:hypothetical protein